MSLHYSQRERNEQLSKAKKSIKWFINPPPIKKQSIHHTNHKKTKSNDKKVPCIAGLSKYPENPNTAHKAQEQYYKQETESLARLAKLLKEHPEKVKLSGYV